MSETDRDHPRRVSVVIVNWNTRDHLDRCLTALRNSECASSTEIVVVDNASSDDSVAMVRNRYPECKLIVNAGNIGFARANNQGIKETHGEFVLLLNPDAYVETQTIVQLTALMNEHADAGAVGPKLLNPDGSLQFSCRAFPTLGAGFFRQTPLGSLFPRNRFTQAYLMTDWDHATPRVVDWLSGACMMLRRCALDEVGGGLDEAYYMYCEDVDVCFQLKQRGWKSYYEPRTSVVHSIGQSSNQAQARMIVERHRAMLRYFIKHHCRGSGMIALPLVLAGIGIRGTGALMRLALNRTIDALRSSGSETSFQ